METPRRISHAKQLRDDRKNRREPKFFDYRRDYKTLDLRTTPELYRVGRGEEGVLLVEPYKAEILPSWRFKTPADAKASVKKIAQLFKRYKQNEDFVGMDMARKFMQMGFTRSRRYANHKSGRKYDAHQKVLPKEKDAVKAASAAIFFEAWQKIEHDDVYADLKIMWRQAFG